MANKPQNLEGKYSPFKTLPEVVGYLSTLPRFMEIDAPSLLVFAREVARATCNAVRVEQISNPDADNDARKSQVPRIAEMLGRQAGFNSAVKAQKDKERSWMGGKR